MFHICQRSLVVLGAVLTAFGLLIAVTSGTPMFDLFNRFIDPAFWGEGPTDHATVAFRGWVYSVWGATIAGWGVVVTLVAHEALRRREQWAWRSLALGSVVWFVLDTASSLLHGVAFNVAFNVLVFVLIAVPLMGCRAETGRPPTRASL